MTAQMHECSPGVVFVCVLLCVPLSAVSCGRQCVCPHNLESLPQQDQRNTRRHRLALRVVVLIRVLIRVLCFVMLFML